MADQEHNLSPDEMAALRDVAVPEVDAADAGERAARIQVTSYNFRQPGRLSSAQLRALKMVHEFFAKGLSEVPPSGVNLPFELGLLSVETISYSNFMGSLGNPCFMAQLSSRFEQPVLMEIDLRVVHMLIAHILGNKDEEREEEGRKLTSIEQGIAGNWLEGLLPLLGESWTLSAPVDFGLKSIECDPRFVQVMPDDSPVVSLTFRLQVGTVKGQLTLCYPLEPLQEMLEGMSVRMSGGDEDDVEQSGDSTLVSLKGIPFELRAELGHSHIRASQLATLRKGDVLCLDRSIHDPVDVLLGDNVVFEAGLGKKGDNLALQIRKRRKDR
ncbi:flagellar motor switch protein FliM [Pontiella agarivorans]|uniref:Flagellar motor switch protein FliM n=1 Tax=Pontiella agarivorans TaxID=3038953 RepID=A0ABU5MSW7_9BACT|nr:FliM/FliN family flagellar motor switch protein [Pontiella agarivorans]MDZ8117294.1 FliM/FliN family flagellar motor switch protein [Pontiella agarivorans]